MVRHSTADGSSIVLLDRLWDKRLRLRRQRWRRAAKEVPKLLDGIIFVSIIYHRRRKEDEAVDQMNPLPRLPPPRHCRWRRAGVLHVGAVAQGNRPLPELDRASWSSCVTLN